MVAMLGLATIGASRRGGIDTPMVPPRQPFLVPANPLELRMIVYRSSATLSGKRGEGCTRRAATSAASERAYVRRLAARGAAGPFSRLDGLRRSFTTEMLRGSDHRGGSPEEVQPLQIRGDI